jgi:TolA-binding protein
VSHQQFNKSTFLSFIYSFALIFLLHFLNRSIFIRICTTGEAPKDPPEEMASAVRQHQKVRPTKTKNKQHKQQSEADRVDDLNDELKNLQYIEDEKQQQEESGDEEGKTFEEVSKEAGYANENVATHAEPEQNTEANEDGQNTENTNEEANATEKEASGDVVKDDIIEEKDP